MEFDGLELVRLGGGVGLKASLAWTSSLVSLERAVLGWSGVHTSAWANGSDLEVQHPGMQGD